MKEFIEQYIELLLITFGVAIGIFLDRAIILITNKQDHCKRCKKRDKSDLCNQCQYKIIKEISDN